MNTADSLIPAPSYVIEGTCNFVKQILQTVLNHLQVWILIASNIILIKKPSEIWSRFF